MADSKSKLVPLCVDLDGTLVGTDTLYESFLRLLRNSPLSALKALADLRYGKARFKETVSRSAALDPASLPYNNEVLEYLEDESQKRDVVLVTGANQRIAEAVVDSVEALDTSLHSDSNCNLTGSEKRDLLVERFGEKGFDYIGNESVDWPVWEASRSCLVVSQDNAFLSETRRKFPVEKEFMVAKPVYRDWAKLIRAHQWVKNLLLFIPFLLDHRFSDFVGFFVVLGCFSAFSFLASATYILNDLLDLESDRVNMTKRQRPLASGIISIQQGVYVAAFLVCLTLVLLLFLPPAFSLVCLIYLVSTLAYSFYLKRVAYLDVCVLAGLHTLRIIAGTVALSIDWSFWLLGFSMFFFLSLALAKRVAELENLKTLGIAETIARGYKTSDVSLLVSSGVSAGHASILIVALYINGEKVTQMYNRPEILWLLCPLLLWWLGRIWLVTTRGRMHEDPIIFAIRDRISQVTLLVCACIVLGAVFV